MSDLNQLVSEAQRAFEAASDAPALEDAKARFLGKTGLLTEQLKQLGKMDPEARKAAADQQVQLFVGEVLQFVAAQAA